MFVCLLVFVCDRLLRFLMFVFFFLSQVRACSGVEACTGEELQTEECNMSSCPGLGYYNP